MVAIAKDLPTAKNRLDGFFKSRSNGMHPVAEFLNFITADGKSAYIFGGVIRDICLKGGKDFHSDIDVVFVGTEEDLELRIKIWGSEHTKTKFGGYRLRLGLFDLDIWTLESTWAFRNNLVRNKTLPEHLLLSTLLNWDAVLWKWRTRILLHEDQYFNDLQQGKLDIVLNVVPNNLKALNKVFRLSTEHDAYLFGPKLQLFIAKTFNQLDINIDLGEAKLTTHSPDKIKELLDLTQDLINNKVNLIAS
jgi:hypothetical protein